MSWRAFSANSGQFDAGIDDDRLDLVAHDAALGVDLVDRHQRDVLQDGFADRHRSRQRVQHADLDRIGSMAATGTPAERRERRGERQLRDNCSSMHEGLREKVVAPGEHRREAWTTRFAAPTFCTARRHVAALQLSPRIRMGNNARSRRGIPNARHEYGATRGRRAPLWMSDGAREPLCVTHAGATERWPGMRSAKRSDEANGASHGADQWRCGYQRLQRPGQHRPEGFCATCSACFAALLGIVS